MNCKNCELANGIHSLYWQAALNSFHETGNKSYILNGLRDGIPMPLFARDFLANFIDGTVGVFQVSCRLKL